jgi:hypothetical protein
MRENKAWPTPAPGRRLRRPVAPRPGSTDRIATGRLIPKRGPATPIELKFRNKSALENK